MTRGKSAKRPRSAGRAPRRSDRGSANARIKGIPGRFRVVWWREGGHMKFSCHHPNLNEWDPPTRLRLLFKIVTRILQDRRYRA